MRFAIQGIVAILEWWIDSAESGDVENQDVANLGRMPAGENA